MIIRIRGWHTVKKIMFSPEEMAADQLALLPTGEFINVSSVSTRLSEIYPRDKFIPMLSLGFADVDSKEIFEGDILAWASGGVNTRWVVERTPGGWNPFIDNMTTDKSFRYRVLGNMYANPELKEVNIRPLYELDGGQGHGKTT